MKHLPFVRAAVVAIAIGFPPLAQADSARDDVTVANISP